MWSNRFLSLLVLFARPSCMEAFPFWHNNGFPTSQDFGNLRWTDSLPVN